MPVLRTLRRLLPQSLRLRLKDLAERLDRLLLPLFSWSGPTASLYYVLCSRKFDREHQAVLQGRRAYSQQALLRRNTHRLEKGLIMRPRKPLFAADYITETVQAFATLQQSERADSELLKWSGDVLTAYFDAVMPHAGQPSADQQAIAIRTAHQAFNGYVSALTAQDERFSDPVATDDAYIPYARAQSPVSDISADALQQLFLRRRSVRWFDNTPVDMETLHRAIDMASLAPSACNRQPYEFVVSYGEQAVSLAKMAMGTVGFAENIPCLIVVVGQLDAYPHERDRHCIYIDASLASMQFMLACETLGLSTCPINWPDIESREQQMQQALKLKPFQRPVMLMGVGYADPEGGIAYSQKKSAAELVREHKRREHRE